MRDFLKLLQKSHFFLLFLVLEAISIFLAVRNTEKETAFVSSANSVTGFIYEKTSYISDYFSLREQNSFLKKENENLKNYINNILKKEFNFSKDIENTGYFYQSANVIKNSVNKPNNIITLNKGKNDGIREDMAVISDNGVVGIVANVSNNYCTVITLVNSKLGLNAKIKRTNYFGALQWDGKNYQYSILYDIPDHSSLYKGDKIITTGYSSIFPEGIMIGTVEDFYKESSFYNIKVKLSQDFNKLKHVYIVDYFDKEEIIQLEDSTYLRYQFY